MPFLLGMVCGDLAALIVKMGSYYRDGMARSAPKYSLFGPQFAEPRMNPSNPAQGRLLLLPSALSGEVRLTECLRSSRLVGGRAWVWFPELGLLMAPP